MLFQEEIKPLVESIKKELTLKHLTYRQVIMFIDCLKDNLLNDLVLQERDKENETNKK